MVSIAGQFPRRLSRVGQAANQEACCEDRSIVRSQCFGSIEDRIALGYGAVASATLHALAPHNVALVAVGAVGSLESIPCGSSPTQISGSGGVDAAWLGSTHPCSEGNRRRAHGLQSDDHAERRQGNSPSRPRAAIGPSLTTADSINLTYTILGGTGKDRGATGTGQATFQVSLPPIQAFRRVAPQFSLTFGPVASPLVSLALVGSIQGTYLKDNDTAMTAPRVFQNATGNITPLGSTSGIGFLTIQNGEPSTGDGDLILADSQGTVALHLSGFQGGPGTLTNLTYTVLGGTGSFVGATGSGAVQIEFGGPLLILHHGQHSGRPRSFRSSASAA